MKQNICIISIFSMFFQLFTIQNLYSQVEFSSASILREWFSSEVHIENKTDTLILKCKVYRIKKIDKAYVIDIDTQDKVTKWYRFQFTIISLKQEKMDLKKIKRGRQYEFQLSFYHPYILVGDPVYEIYKIGGEKIGFKGDLRTGRIVTTPNLHGLYYIPPK